jgi:hypothetical protein
LRFRAANKNLFLFFKNDKNLEYARGMFLSVSLWWPTIFFHNKPNFDECSSLTKGVKSLHKKQRLVMEKNVISFSQQQKKFESNENCTLQI